MRANLGRVDVGKPVDPVDCRAWPFVGRKAERHALRQILRHSGAVIVGPAGVGKTRLATETAAELAAAGQRCLSARGWESARAIPLGGLVGVLPAHSWRGPDLAAMMSQAVATLAAAADLPVLLLDDAHLLDDASAVVVGHLVATGTVRLLATVREGRQLPEALRGLLVSGAIERFELGVLSADDVAELLAAAFDGPVHRDVVSEITGRSGGLPLFVRELVLGAMAGAALRHTDGVWHLDPGAALPPRLAGLLEARLAGVGPGERETLELIALAEPVGLRLLIELSDAEAVERLERAGLIVVGRDDRRLPVRLCHPLYAELVNASTPVTARLRYCRVLADRIESHGLRRDEDLMRWAVWRLDGGGPLDPSRIGAAARRVTALRGNAALRDRLTQAAHSADPSISNGLLRYHHLREAARHTQARQLLDELAAHAVTDGERVEVAVAQAYGVGWSAERVDDGIAILTAAARRTGDERRRAELRAHEGFLLTTAARPGEALQRVRPLLDAPWPKVSMLATVTAALAYPLLARFPEAIAAAGRVERMAAVAEEHGVSLPPTLPGVRARAECEYGDPRTAIQSGLSALREAGRRGDPVGQAWTGVAVATIRLAIGELASAEVHAAEAERLFTALDIPSGTGLALATRLAAAAQRGDHSASARLAARLGKLPRLGLESFAVAVVRAHAWHDQITGDRDGAQHRLNTAAHTWLANRAWLPATLAALDLFRLRFPKDAAVLLERVDMPADWPFGHAVKELATADRPEAIVEVAATFARLGFRLYAAEAFALGAARRDGGLAARQRTRAASEAAALATACQARTPLLDDVGAVRTLTKREREVAALAAGGRSNRDIAHRLGVSERTVETHLHHAFTKLGIAQRADLRAALADPP